ncbi:MAG: hypothetical protein ACOX9R_04520 [Armatimonadota bacterium]|jgi:hypothetical protein
MSFPTTDRLKRWYESHEVHFAVAGEGGDVRIGIAPRVRFTADDRLAVEVPPGVWRALADYIREGAWIALHPGELGAVKAPYQLKGLIRLERNADTIASWFPETDAPAAVEVALRELYITKPGPEAGQRVDNWTADELTEFERQLGWLKEENL